MKEDNQVEENSIEDTESSESNDESKDEQLLEKDHLLFGLVIVIMLLILSGYIRVRRQIPKLGS
jgi:hypothetical protein